MLQEDQKKIFISPPNFLFLSNLCFLVFAHLGKLHSLKVDLFPVTACLISLLIYTRFCFVLFCFFAFWFFLSQISVWTWSWETPQTPFLHYLLKASQKKAKFIWLKPVLLLHSTLTGSFVLAHSGTVRSGNLI